MKAGLYGVVSGVQFAIARLILALPLVVFVVFLWKNIFHEVSQGVDCLLSVCAFGF